uniref:Uncharacterized protein n=1 Tax=Anguilla anguilla TaxID=7936 RepID=A0A0E9TUW3_ANGAN
MIYTLNNSVYSNYHFGKGYVNSVSKLWFFPPEHLNMYSCRENEPVLGKVDG